MTSQDDIYDPQFVRHVFDRCSGQYILFSWLFSFGFTERWRKQCVSALPSPGSNAPTGYDLMAGTGEVWPHLLSRFPTIEKIVAVDISSGMHRRAIDRLHRHRSHQISFVEDDVLQSALEDESADFIVSTFGLKTFDAKRHRTLAKLVARLLRPGGTFAMIEASDPKDWWLGGLYRFYMMTVLPLIERLFLRGAQDFAMIGQYTANFGDAQEFAGFLRTAGLSVVYRKHFFGCATSVSGFKPITP